LRLSNNADDFRGAVENALRRFTNRKSDWMKRYGPQFADKLRDNKEAILEHHLRIYFVDEVLRALNWSLTGTDAEEPNLLAEIPIISPETGTTKFMDYLGLETATATPLLLVETKRYGSALPQKLSSPQTELPAILTRALSGNQDLLTHYWSDWIAAVGHYVRSAAERGGAPRRAVMTDGDWIIVFTNPHATFVAGVVDANAIVAGDIAVFSFSRIEADYAALFELLEYQQVLGELQPLAPTELRFHVRPEHVDRIMHGLRVIFAEEPRFLYPAPYIRVKPIVLLATTLGGWIVVEEQVEGEPIPAGEDQLANHLERVRAQAEQLLADVSAQFGRDFVPVPLTTHYDDPTAFAPMPGVRYRTGEVGERRFIMATGQQTHYLRLKPSVTDCPYHAWLPDHGRTEAPRGQSVTPPSFFTAGALHYCGHRAVEQVKRSPANDANRDLTGLRSARPGGAFCEIWTLDQFLCCRTCSFEEVCTNRSSSGCRVGVILIRPSVARRWSKESMSSPSVLDRQPKAAAHPVRYARRRAPPHLRSPESSASQHRASSQALSDSSRQGP
jgi:hypothetical protein